MMSFGHFEPQSYISDKQDESRRNESGQADSLQKHSLIKEKGSQVELRMYLEDFADMDKIDKDMIWRLFRVSIS